MTKRREVKQDNSLNTSSGKRGRDVFVERIKSGDIESIKKFVNKQKSKDIDVITLAIDEKKGIYPIHVAIKSGHFEIVEYFIDNGADINQWNDRNPAIFPAFQALRHDQLEIAALIMETGGFNPVFMRQALENEIKHPSANTSLTRSVLNYLRVLPDAVDNDLCFLLARNSRFNLLERVFDGYADKIDINHVNLIYEKTILQYAIEIGNLDLINDTIRNFKDKINYANLLSHFADSDMEKEKVKYLLKEVNNKKPSEKEKLYGRERIPQDLNASEVGNVIFRVILDLAKGRGKVIVQGEEVSIIEHMIELGIYDRNIIYHLVKIKQFDFLDDFFYHPYLDDAKIKAFKRAAFLAAIKYSTIEEIEAIREKIWNDFNQEWYRKSVTLAKEKGREGVLEYLESLEVNLSAGSVGNKERSFFETFDTTATSVRDSSIYASPASPASSAASVDVSSQKYEYEEFNADDLIEAAYYGEYDMVKEIIASGVEPDARSNNYDGTALHYATVYGHIDVVNHLLSVGASVFETTSDGKTVLINAVDYKHAAIVLAILDNSSDNINEKDGDGLTALIKACTRGPNGEEINLNIIRALLAFGADPNIFVPERFYSPVINACIAGNKEAVEFLKDYPGVDFNKGVMMDGDVITIGELAYAYTESEMRSDPSNQNYQDILILLESKDVTRDETLIIGSAFEYSDVDRGSRGYNMSVTPLRVKFGGVRPSSPETPYKPRSPDVSVVDPVAGYRNIINNPNEFYNDDILDFIMRSSLDQNHSYYISPVLTKGKINLEGALSRFIASDKDQAVVMLNPDNIHFAALQIKKEGDNYKALYVDPTGGLYPIDDYVKEALDEVLGINSEDIKISVSKIQSYQETGSAAILDNHHCGPFILFLMVGLVNEEIIFQDWDQRLGIKQGVGSKNIPDLNSDLSDQFGMILRRCHKAVISGEEINRGEVMEGLDAIIAQQQAELDGSAEFTTFLSHTATSLLSAVHGDRNDNDKGRN